MVPDAVVPTLKQLYLALGQALHGLGLPVEQRPFQPHLTLARRHLRPLTPCDAAPLLWHVDHYVLVQSQATKQHAYRVLQEYACA